MSVVIDTSALMALIKLEPGAVVVSEALPEGLASPVIFAECLCKAALLGYPANEVEAKLLGGGLRLAPLELGDLRAVAALFALARRGVSLADRFCLALAMEMRLPLLTADRPWRDLGLPVDLRYIR